MMTLQQVGSRVLSHFARIVTLVVIVSIGVGFGRATGTMAQTCTTPPVSPTGWWQGNGSGLDIANGRNATLNNGATFGAGLVGQAFLFDGTNDDATVANDAALNVGTGNFTVDFWVNRASTSDERVMVEKWNETTNSGWTLAWRFNALYFASSGTAIQTSTPIPANTWTHIALRRSGSAVTLFVNGSQIASGTDASNLTTSVPLLFGRRRGPQGFFLGGRIDEIHYFVGHALTNAEIASIYNSGSAGLCRCGSGTLEGSESCDDGNVTSGDGCSSLCQVEPCYACSGQPSICAPDNGAACDDGVFCNGADTCNAGSCGHAGDPCSGGAECNDVCNEATDDCFSPISQACSDDSNSCTTDFCDAAGACGHTVIDVCGDSMQCGSEQCDDGNFDDGDGCDSTCRTTGCGSGARTVGESCDDGNGINGDGCDNNCKFSGCGNGAVGGTEACDDGNRVNGDGCDNNCTVTACGNGVPTAGETCSETLDPNLSWDTAFAAGGANDLVSAVAVAGSDVYVGGYFGEIGGVAAAGVARWNGTTWQALGSGVNGAVETIKVVGSDIYFAGSFDQAGGVPANNIAKWNGSAWSALGDGTDGEVFALAVVGSDLFAAGAFSSAGGVTVNNIARWDGSTWSALGVGTDEVVWTLAVIGADLYAGGGFQNAGGVAAAYVARWNGSTWSDVAGGLPENAFAVAAQGTRLWATGEGYVAYRDAGAWVTLPVDGDFGYALAVGGDHVFLGGDFTAVGGVTAKNIAWWNGSTWLAMGSGVNDQVDEMTVSGNTLYAVGFFTSAGNLSTGSLARWSLPFCGDGAMAPGEYCDDGNVTNGDGCDNNCTPSACGNGIQAGAESCDDGNLISGDGCDNNCTATACGNGIRTAATSEACDDGNLVNDDGCESDCRITPVEDSVPPGGTVSTGGSASPELPIQTSITTPDGGTIAIATADEPLTPAGVQALIEALLIEAPPATVAEPLVVVLTIDASAIPPGVDLLRVDLTRNGEVLGDCTGPVGTATPDPCIQSRELLMDGDVRITGLTSHASLWSAVVRGQSKPEQKCVGASNAAGVKVAKAQAKANLTCLVAAAKGEEGNAQACLTADTGGKVAKALQKTVDVQAGSCAITPPFGFALAAVVNPAAQSSQLDGIADVFGSNLNDTIIGSGDAAGAKCQLAVLKAVNKLFDAKTKAFVKCKKGGLAGKAGLFISGPQLASCFDTLTADADGKIGKVVAKLAATLGSTCEGVNLPTAFPGPCGSTAAPASCLHARSNCRVCQMFNDMDALTQDCDDFDDGTLNGSCS